MNMDEMERVLEKNGLQPNERKVYLALLRLGTGKVGEICKRAQINRTTTYDVLGALLDKGLASYVVEGRKKWFKAADPNRLVENIENLKEETKKAIPELSKIFNFPKEKYNVTLYYGYKGLKTVYMERARDGSPGYVLDSQCQSIKRMQYFWPQFVRLLNKKKIKIKHLVNPGNSVNPSKCTEVRYLKIDISKGNTTTIIYGDKVVLVLWTEPPEAVVIKNKATAEVYKNYFNLLWNIAKKP